MIDTIKNIYRREQFRPSWLSIFINSNYIIRTGIYEAVRDNAKYMTGRMLDIGCGTKPYADLLSVNDYVGMEVHTDAHDNDTSKVDVFYDGKHIPFDEATFDSAYSCEVLMHIPDLQPVIAEIYRVLKPGGRFFTTVTFVWHENEPPHDYLRFTSFGIVDLLQRHGFNIIHQEKKGNFFTAAIQTRNAFLYRALFPKSELLRLPLVLLLIAPANIASRLLSPIFGRNKDLFNNMVVVAEKPL